MNVGLFEESEASIPSGLSYKPDFLSVTQATEVLTWIDSKEWLGDLERRVQHYGYKYDYRARRIDASMRIGPLGGPLKEVANRLYDERIFGSPPDQVIINEYLPGQGIAPHIDCEPCFDDTIVTISLGSPCVMHFEKVLSGEVYDQLLSPRSIAVLKGESRYLWKHSIAKRKSDLISGAKQVRGRRVSLTFRKVLL